MSNVGLQSGGIDLNGGRRVCYVVRVRVTFTTVLALAACSSDPPSISPFPIPVDTSTGPVLLQLEFDVEGVDQCAAKADSAAGPDGGQGDGSATCTGLVDTMSPITIIDTYQEGKELATPRRRTLDLGLKADGEGVTRVTRARLRGVETLDLHPCGIPDAGVGPCAVGTTVDGVDQREWIRGILGADALSPYAVRFEVAASRMSLFPDIAGDNLDRARMCEAVFPTPFHGGGILVVGGAEKPYSGRRMALGACFLNVDEERELREMGAGSEPFIASEPGLRQGLDALFLVSTGLGITIVANSTYERYRLNAETLTGSPAPPPTSIPITIYLSSGPIEAQLGQLNHLALIAEESDQRGPCYERYANAFMTDKGRCEVEDIDNGICPCQGDSRFCRAGAVVELCGSFPVAVVKDDHPVLQGLRDELRPALPEIDGILGTDILSQLIVDVDYPNGRVILRCAEDTESCHIRPAVLNQTSTGDGDAGVLERCPKPIACDAALPSFGGDDRIEPGLAVP
ncbi:MAG: hypothetical protein MJE77_15640 [Proteobacteria bacterium]|nr:hypothetical protein [Pseudomonadota bacterium]